MAVNLAISPCPNDTFVFHAWVHGLVPGAPAVHTEYADVEVLNARAMTGRPDVVKVSYGALPWLLDRYALLPCGGALGRGCGPLVLTRPGEPELAGRTVAVPGERTTAYLLFRMWAAGLGVGRIQVMPFDRIMPAVRDGLVDAGLVIHEARFTYPRYGLELRRDLGAWWEQETGLPIPLGAVLARRGLDLDLLRVTVRASVELAWSDPAATRGYVREHASELDDDVTAAHIDLYVNDFTAELGEEGYAAVAALLERSAAAGLTPEPAGTLR